MTTDIQVFDFQGNPQVLGAVLGRGGEGVVRPLAARADVIVKSYHAEKLQQHGAQLAAKVEAMRALRQKFGRAAVSWPLLSVFDAQRNWIGYAMYRAHGVPMSRLAHAMLYQKAFPGLDRIGLVSYLIEYLDAIAQLHASGVMVGDYNLNNVMCLPGSSQVTLIDCDSYQLEHGGQLYPCPVGSPDMTAPEQHGQAFEHIRRTPESEAFSVAIVLFKCLMLGRHPYDIVGGEDPVSNLRSGRFAYGRGNRGIPKGPWYNIWSHMPYRLKDLFITTFTTGAEQVAQRPGLATWREALRIYRRDMQKGWHETAIRPAQAKPAEHRNSTSGSQTSASLTRDSASFCRV